MLNIYFYRHHYLSFGINIFCLLFLSIIDIIGIKEEDKNDTLNLLIMLFVNFFRNVIFSFQDVIGKITEERLANDLLRGYLIASRNMNVDNERAYYNIMLVGTGTIDSYTLCFGETDGYYDDNTSTKAGIRPVVELPSSLLVYEKERLYY